VGVQVVFYYYKTACRLINGHLNEIRPKSSVKIGRCYFRHETDNVRIHNIILHRLLYTHYTRKTTYIMHIFYVLHIYNYYYYMQYVAGRYTDLLIIIIIIIRHVANLLVLNARGLILLFIQENYVSREGTTSFDS